MRTSVISNRAVKTIYFKHAVCLQQLNLVVLTACVDLLSVLLMELLIVPNQKIRMTFIINNNN